MSTTETTFAPQGSEAWHAARRGKITASRFNDVLTQPQSKAAKIAGEMGKTARTYMLDIIAEILTGIDQGPPVTAAMEHGNTFEPEAREVYENRFGVKVEQCGFITHPDEPMIGCSPDGFVGDEGGVEFKCPHNTAIHLGYVLAGELPKDYAAQVYGGLWINPKRKWWDFVSYDPRIPTRGYRDIGLALWRHRVWRPKDGAPIIVKDQQLDTAVLRFKDQLLETLCTLRGRTQ